MRRVSFEPDFESWREKARVFLQAGVHFHDLEWKDAEQRQFLLLNTEPSMGFTKAGKAEQPKKQGPSFVIDKNFLHKAELASYARVPDRWDLLYRMFYRLKFENPHLHKIAIDEDVRKIESLAKEVRTDIHKAHAFVRFRRTEVDGLEAYIAWHRPEHLIMKATAPFFVRRFGDKNWSILTPDICAHWREGRLSYAEGVPQAPQKENDFWEEAWVDYYSAIFNPGRINLKAMQASMPQKYWQSMPETKVIQELIRDNPARLNQMAAAHFHQAKVPLDLSMSELKELAKSCTACPIHQQATQTVFGAGSLQAEIMIVGEQPGSEEDLGGDPFCGPSGEVLDLALLKAELPRQSLYITNAVKHFKFHSNDKVRLHKKAAGSEMHACRPWLEREIQIVKPKLLVLLGVTAATSVLGRLAKISEERGVIQEDSSRGFATLISWHPAAILRSSSKDEKELRQKELFQDFLMARKYVDKNRIKVQTLASP